MLADQVTHTHAELFSLGIRPFQEAVRHQNHRVAWLHEKLIGSSERQAGRYGERDGVGGQLGEFIASPSILDERAMARAEKGQHLFFRRKHAQERGHKLVLEQIVEKQFIQAGARRGQIPGTARLSRETAPGIRLS